MKLWIAILCLVALGSSSSHAAIGKVTEQLNTPPSIQRDKQTLTGAKGTGVEMNDAIRTQQGKVRYLAFKHEVVSIRNAQGVPKAWISRRVGGDQIDYADESQAVRTRFEESLAKHGMKPRMEEAYEAELPTLPPKS